MILLNAMKSIALKLDNKIFEETERILKDVKMSRNKYINKAVSDYNRAEKRKAMAEQFKKDSLLCREESMKVLHEFEAIEDDLD